MHFVTKMLVVFAAVLAVLVAGLTMAYSLNADMIVSDYREQQQLRDVAEQELSAAMARHGDERALLQQQIQSGQAELASRNEQMIQLEAEVAELRTEKRTAELRAESIQNQIGQSLATTSVQAAMIDAYRIEIAQLRDQELASREQMIQLEDALNDAQSRNEVLVQQTRALQEQLKEIENQIASTGGLGDGARLSTAAFGTLRNIKGRVVETREDKSTDQTLVELDVGENDGVEVGMVMAAWRGQDEYLCNIEVIAVDLQTSVGKVQFFADNRVTLRAGDHVATNIR